MTSRSTSGRAPLEMWAGLECTLNRVGDNQHDQLELTGHYGRLGDIDRLADLGVRTIRYPILWERAGTGADHGARWEWTDRVMGRLQTLGIDPIVGLVHHGSGPSHVTLLDEGFATGLEAFARSVARRYPWITRYTPVNEPLTTARFSCLYGVWHPHATGDAPFLRAMLNQVRAIRLAMAAVREANPDARLVQTEDLGRAHSTAALEYQAQFENERRWLTFDLLLGRVDASHPLADYARRAGVSQADIEQAVGEGCTPELLGINHYLTSERWLDERLARYPATTHGGNGMDAYADVESVRVAESRLAGPLALIRETWERYRLPIAITEAHLRCTREQQMRWLHEMWQAAVTARESGIDVRAVTAWAALGAFDWSSLVTRMSGDYETGLFDVRAPVPRATGLAAMTRALAVTGRHAHPVLAGAGWWRSPTRVTYRDDTHADAAPSAATEPTGRPILIAGCSGTLGRAFARVCTERGLAHRGYSRRDLDITDATGVDRAIRECDPWAVVNATGYVRVDDAEWNPDACHHVNTRGATVIAAACATYGIPLATFSSDLVFDGVKGRPYIESDLPRPLNVYGASKAEAEKRVLDCLATALVVRTAWFFGPWDDSNVVTLALRDIAAGSPVDAPLDLVFSPTYVPDLANSTLDLLIDGEKGIWHLANTGAVSGVELLQLAARHAGLDETLVRGRPFATLGLVAARPPHAPLSSERGTLMPALEHAIAHYVGCRPWERKTHLIEMGASSAGD